jgi:hypothetical protein
MLLRAYATRGVDVQHPDAEVAQHCTSHRVTRQPTSDRYRLGIRVDARAT